MCAPSQYGKRFERQQRQNTAFLGMSSTLSISTTCKTAAQVQINARALGRTYAPFTLPAHNTTRHAQAHLLNIFLNVRVNLTRSSSQRPAGPAGCRRNRAPRTSQTSAAEAHGERHIVLQVKY